jgi:four helix bundle protein
MALHSYKDLIAWQKAMDLVTEVYKIVKIFPSSEKFGLISQMKRSVVSIPSNIAEGRRRSTRKDYKQFMIIAYGSGAELETQIEIAKRLKFASEISFKRIDELLEEVMKMLNKYISSLSA